MDLRTLGHEIAKRRKERGLTQAELAKSARVGRTTLDGLENGRFGELGFSKITRILAMLGLELRLGPAAARRPTLEDLLTEDGDQSLE